MRCCEFCRYKIIKASVGKNHTVVVTDEGKSFAFGHNKHGQLGTGSLRNGWLLSLLLCLCLSVVRWMPQKPWLLYEKIIMCLGNRGFIYLEIALYIFFWQFSICYSFYQPLVLYFNVSLNLLHILRICVKNDANSEFPFTL
jgi:hypothetical protein